MCDGLGTHVNTELLIEVGEVVARRLRADAQPLGDFLVCQPGGSQREHFFLTRGELSMRRPSCARDHVINGYGRGAGLDQIGAGTRVWGAFIQSTELWGAFILSVFPMADLAR